jgi:signal transduction histidine kinase
MTDAASGMSRWAKLTMAGFTLGGSYFVIQGSKVTEQWWLLALLLIFVCLAALLAMQKIKQWQQGVLGILVLLCTLMTLSIEQHVAMLYVVVCLLAIETLRKRTAIIWVGACILAVFASELVNSPNSVNVQDAFVNSLLALFLIGFAFLRLEAETGRRQTRQLLHELEAKNLQLATYAAEQEQQSRIEERQRLSRELHDTLGHKLTTSIVQLEAAHKLLEQDPGRVNIILTTVRSLLKDGLDETRNIVRLLDQDESREQSLVAVIRPLVSAFQSATGLSVSLQMDCDEALIPAFCKQHLFRIVQEALTNISRHADASEVHIKLTAGDVIELLIEDNGMRLNDYRGDSLPPVKSIESRVAELKGKLKFVREGALTRLVVEVPFSQTGGNSVH